MYTDIDYETKASLTPEEVLEFYGRQGHAGGESREAIRRMLDNTFCVVAARRDGELIGLARGVVSGPWGHLSECKLDPGYQGPACVTKTDGRIEHDDSGIAREMARRVIAELCDSGVEKIGVVAYETEVDFCKELGFKQAKGVVWMELEGGALRSTSDAVSNAAVP